MRTFSTGAMIGRLYYLAVFIAGFGRCVGKKRSYFPSTTPAHLATAANDEMKGTRVQEIVVIEERDDQVTS